MRQQRMQVERTMCLTAMQIDSDGNYGDVSKAQNDQHKLPPGKIEYAINHSVFSSGDRTARCHGQLRHAATQPWPLVIMITRRRAIGLT